jgi:hypothetical protein
MRRRGSPVTNVGYVDGVLVHTWYQAHVPGTQALPVVAFNEFSENEREEKNWIHSLTPSALWRIVDKRYWDRERVERLSEKEREALWIMVRYFKRVL